MKLKQTFSRQIKMNKIDLHIHSKASDGIKNHREIYDLFKEKGYSAISIADHNGQTIKMKTMG